jgi:GNAT superfamily N-acetyltransferase
MPEVTCRVASVPDAAELAAMNLSLIQDEGHRNSMNLVELTARMSGWLKADYAAVLFSESGKSIGYALYRFEPDHVYLRQFFVTPEKRRQGVGKQAMFWMWTNVWRDVPRIRLDVLVGNSTAHAFWESVGFTDYCITMEAERA